MVPGLIGVVQWHYKFRSASGKHAVGPVPALKVAAYPSANHGLRWRMAPRRRAALERRRFLDFHLLFYAITL